MSKIVTLMPAFSGPTAGYRAVVVQRVTDEWADEGHIDTVLTHGPFSDAMLLARSDAIAFAHKLGLPFCE